jgi:L-glyceraldehyde 3-phosphate reductase
VETDLLPAAREHGVGVIVFSPLASGLLSSRYLNGIPADSRAAQDAIASPRLRTQLESGEMVGKLRSLNELAEARGQSLAQMALAWILRLPEITSVLMGASRVEQVEQNVAALANLEFSPEELAKIEAILS